MVTSEKLTKLSKHLSYILRHDPGTANLELDEEGFAPLNEVISHLKESGYEWIDLEKIEKLVMESDRNRFEIDGGRIRALYGHSVEVQIDGEFEPPELLYHGTSPEVLSSIFENGLKPMRRKYVHLSRGEEEAFNVGKRHHPEPVVLEVWAKKAYLEGVVFYDRGDVVLVECVPPEYIEVTDPKG